MSRCARGPFAVNGIPGVWWGRLCRGFWTPLLLWIIFVDQGVVVASSVEETLAQAKNTYRYGDYAKVILLLRPLLFPRPGKLRTRLQRAEAYRFLAFSYFQDRFRLRLAVRKRLYLKKARQHLQYS
ncbi:MAG: hypothetical protein AAGJ35_15265, partial [Myxococcota bacterium]